MRNKKKAMWAIFLTCILILQAVLLFIKVFGYLEWIWFWVLMPIWISVVIGIVDYLFTKIEQDAIEFNEDKNNEL